jgi:hypothetical protein
MATTQQEASQDLPAHRLILFPGRPQRMPVRQADLRLARDTHLLSEDERRGEVLRDREAFVAKQLDFLAGYLVGTPVAPMPGANPLDAQNAVFAYVDRAEFSAGLTAALPWAQLERVFSFHVISLRRPYLAILISFPN